MPSKTRKAAAQASYQQGQRKNFVHNGDMAVAQRGSAQSISASGGFAMGQVDGWKIYMGSAAAVDASQDAESPDAFNNSLKLDITTADTSVAAGDIAYIEQRFEGLNLQSINKGDAQAKALTVSFYVRSPVTGVHIVEAMDLDNSNRSSSQSYTIASADTWEYHSVTFPPDTTGALDDDNEASFKIQFWLIAGSTYSGGGSLNTSWGTTTNTRAVGQVNVLGDASDNFYLTGVQMELGNTATEFQYESHAENLARCQRYYQVLSVNEATGNQTNSMYYTTLAFAAEMNHTPAIVASYAFGSLSGNFETRVTATFGSGVNLVQASPNAIAVRGNTSNAYNWIRGNLHVESEL